MIECGDRFMPQEAAQPLMGIRCRVLRPVQSELEKQDREKYPRSFNAENDPSDKHVFFTLCGPDIPRHEAPTEDAPPLMLRWLDGACGVPGPYYYAEPPNPPDDKPGHYTAGSNYLTSTSHSIRQLMRPMGIFDRFERHPS